MNILVKTILLSFLFLHFINASKIIDSKDSHEKGNIFGRLAALSFQEINNFIRGASIPIDNKCLSYYNSLADISSKFIECVANNSRPFHICQNCLTNYLKFNQLHKLIQNVINLLIN